MKKYNSAYTAFFLIAFLLMACKDDNENNSVVPTTGSRTEFTQDSIFLYAEEAYLWYDDLPDYTTFAPRSYTDASTDLENFQNELFDLTQYPINPNTGYSYEYVSATASYSKYSFIMENDASSNARLRAASAIDDSNYDFGIELTAITAYDIRLSYVAPNSPADHADLARGLKVIQINNQNISAASQSAVNYVNSALNSSPIQLTTVSNDGDTVSTTLSMETYVEDPIYTTKVIDVDDESKTGYLCMSYFAALSDVETELEDVFSDFSDAGVSTLIVDFRYNGGGYVQTAAYLLDLIAPSSLDGQKAYSETFNDKLQNGKAKVLANQLVLDSNGDPISYQNRYATYADIDYTEDGNTAYFDKTGDLDNLSTVVFIVTGSTASASELVINALSPYLNVILVGDQTYGKPVGFFEIGIDEYSMYIPNFQIYNADGEGDYFDGFTPDIYASDDPTYDLGDAEEASLSAALAYIKDGTTDLNGRKSDMTPAYQSQVRAIRVPGMIETKKSLKE